MTEPFANARGSSLRARRKSLPHSRLVHLDALYIQSIDIDAQRVLRIGNRGPERFRNEPRRAFGNELKHIQSVFNSPAANLIDDEPHLSRGDSKEFRNRACFHGSAISRVL